MVGCTVLALTAAGTFARAQAYTARFLGAGVYGKAINNNGEVVGVNNNDGHAFSYTTTGDLIDLGTLGGSGSEAFSANDDGQIVGASEYTTNGAVHAFSYTTRGGMVDLGTLNGSQSAALGINNYGEIVGNSDASNGIHAFSYTGTGGMVDLGTFLGTDSEVDSINDEGLIIGYYDPDPYYIWVHAFSYTAESGMVDLGTLDGLASLARAVNDSGEIVGSLSVWGILGTDPHAFSYTASDGMVDLGTLGGWKSEALGINNHGEIVGWSSTTTNAEPTDAFLYLDGVMVDLNSLIPPGSGIYLTNAVAINNNGQIVANGFLDGTNGAFLLTPSLPCPAILNNATNFGLQADGFGFSVFWPTNGSLVVQACTSLANPTWQPLQTNLLRAGNGVGTFTDLQWSNYPARFYRIISFSN